MSEVSKEQLQVIADKMNEARGFKKNADGSVDLTVKVSAEIVTIIESWCEQSQEDFPTRLQREVEEGLTAIVYSSAA